jgi:hypothetical protein
MECAVGRCACWVVPVCGARHGTGLATALELSGSKQVAVCREDCHDKDGCGFSGVGARGMCSCIECARQSLYVLAARHIFLTDSTAARRPPARRL